MLPGRPRAAQENSAQEAQGREFLTPVLSPLPLSCYSFAQTCRESTDSEATAGKTERTEKKQAPVSGAQAPSRGSLGPRHLAGPDLCGVSPQRLLHRGARPFARPGPRPPLRTVAKGSPASPRRNEHATRIRVGQYADLEDSYYSLKSRASI